MFKDIYEFNVIDELKKGTDVKCFDKLEVVHYDLLDMSVDDMFKILNQAKDDAQQRFLFYYREEDANDDSV